MTDSPNRQNHPADHDNAEAPDARDVLADGLATAAARAGFDRMAEGEQISGRDVLGAMGGVRGILEAILPGAVFLIIFTITGELIPSVIAPAVLGLLFIGIRLIQRSQVTPAVGGLIGIVLSALLALRTGEGKDFYVLGFWTNGAYGTVLLVSVLVGWPLLGVAVGFLMGEGTAWRKNRGKYRAMRVLTLVWVAFFGLRLAVQLPLYFANNVEALGITRLAMGPPLYGVLIVISWLYVRAIYAKHPAPDRSAPATTA